VFLTGDVWPLFARNIAAMLLIGALFFVAAAKTPKRGSPDMWNRIAALIVKELFALLRDPKARLVLVGPPIVQLLVLSYAATLEVKNVDIAVLNRDSGYVSHELLSRIDGSPTFRNVVSVDNLSELHEAVTMRRVIAAIHIGSSFSRDVAARRPARVQVILDGRRSNAAQIVAGYLSQIVERLSADLSGGARRPAAAPVIVARNWFNPSIEFLWHTVPGLIGVISLLTGIVVTALSVTRERELGTFDQLMVSPLRTHEILIGKTIPPLLIGLFHTTLFILAAVFVFHVPLRGSVPLLYASAVLYLAALIGIGLFISAISATQQQAILGAFLFGSPAILLSGFATPIENMPGWLQTLTWANPLRHFLVDQGHLPQGAALRGGGAEQRPAFADRRGHPGIGRVALSSSHRVKACVRQSSAPANRIHIARSTKLLAANTSRRWTT
jgi:ABC-2 type transport system permease protein